MAGIECFGAYVPIYRLTHEQLGKTWGVPHGKGERSVAGVDEDSLTMAVEAGVDCLGSRRRSKVDGLFFASTTSPFLEKQAATTIGTALDLKREISTMDSLGSLRSATAALKAALDAVKAGSNTSVLVSAADCRIAYPGSSLEQILGDGSAAVLIGDSGVTVSVEGFFSLSDEITDYWRRGQDRFVHFWEERFVMVEGFNRIVPEAVAGAMDRFRLKPKDITKLVGYAPSERSYWQMAGKLGFDPNTQVHPPLFSTVGNTGAAFGLMQLVACLEEASPGERILLVNYGNGCDVVFFEVGEGIERAKDQKGLRQFLASKKILSGYQQYVAFRGLLPNSDERMPPVRPPATVVWRDQDSLLRFHGMKCNHCGHVQYPIHRICSNCFNKDDYEEIRLSDRTGEVFSCTVDNLGYGAGTHPFWAIVDFQEVRTRIEIADAELGEVTIGDQLEMTFRKFPSENDVPVYGWKARRKR